MSDAYGHYDRSEFSDLSRSDRGRRDVSSSHGGVAYCGPHCNRRHGRRCFHEAEPVPGLFIRVVRCPRCGRVSDRPDDVVTQLCSMCREATPPPEGTEARAWWSAGARAEAAARREGLSPAVLEVLDVVEGLGRWDREWSQDELAASVYLIFCKKLPRWRRIWMLMLAQPRGFGWDRWRRRGERRVKRERSGDDG